MLKGDISKGSTCAPPPGFETVSANESNSFPFVAPPGYPLNGSAFSVNLNTFDVDVVAAEEPLNAEDGGHGEEKEVDVIVTTALRSWKRNHGMSARATVYENSNGYYIFK